MHPPPDAHEIEASDDEQRHVVALAQRVDAVAKAVLQTRDDIGGVAHDVRALRQEVHALRAGVEELLRPSRPVGVPAAVKGTSRPTEVVYLAAGLAVAAVAVLLAIYLFTGT